MNILSPKVVGACLASTACKSGAAGAAAGAATVVGLREGA